MQHLDFSTPDRDPWPANIVSAISGAVSGSGLQGLWYFDVILLFSSLDRVLGSSLLGRTFNDGHYIGLVEMNVDIAVVGTGLQESILAA